METPPIGGAVPFHWTRNSHSSWTARHQVQPRRQVLLLMLVPALLCRMRVSQSSSLGGGVTF